MNQLDTIYLQLKAMPQAALLINRLSDELKDEQKRRQAFYNLVHENLNAEFINGEIVMHSPVMERHWRSCTNLTTFLNYYVLINNLGRVGTEKVMIRLTRNDYEPDIVFFTTEKSQHFTPTQLLFPAPDLAVEILSDSTRERDYTLKMADYAAHGIPEYWIIDPDQETVEQYLITDNEYYLHQKLYKQGMLKAQVVKDFEIEISKIFA